MYIKLVEIVQMEIDSKLVECSLYDLEEKVATCQHHHSAVETLIQRVQRRYVTTLCIPLPSIFVEDNNYKNPTSLWVENCPFCGLAPQPLRGVIFASYKHVYRGLCAHNHFSKSTNCVVVLCEKEMHEGWWKATDVLRLGTQMFLLHKQFQCLKLKALKGNYEGMVIHDLT
jgi:hypothetical protein